MTPKHHARNTATATIVFCLCTTVLAGILSADSKPNIILIFADDISARELPVYGSTVWSPPESGDTSDPSVRAKTPVLDQLANDGCWFETAWASVVCSPSRAMMMTGRYAHLHKWWTNKDYGMVTDKRGRKVAWPLYESSPNLIGHVAQQGGYATFWAGKTQMKSANLQRFGFDEGCFSAAGDGGPRSSYTDFRLVLKNVDGQRTLINEDTGKPSDKYMMTSYYWKPSVGLMNRPDAAEAFEVWPNTAASKENYGLNTYGPDIELEFIFDFMERQTEADKPFFVYHTSHLGHDAFNWLDPDSPSRWPGTPVIRWDGNRYIRTEPNITGDNGVYDTRGTVTDPGIHHHINYLDYQVWLYRNKLEELGIADNTILIFTADNGTSGYGKHSSDRQKGTHVPLIIYAPGQTKQGKQAALVDMADMLPTITELAGAALPEDYEINGESLVPYLFTDKQSHRPWIYAYKKGEQIIRGAYVLKDGWDRWWDVTSRPDDLISFQKINDWSTVSPAHRLERDKLQAVLPQFDLYATEHDPQ